MTSLIIFTFTFLLFLKTGSALWCYECVSTQPGCGRPFNWLYHWTKICPEDDDVCVKITETRGVDTVITRSCLSTVQSQRSDIPADKYEGCRPAALDVKLGHYVNNSIKELDIHRDYYESTEWCFCFLDHRCNSSPFLFPSLSILATLLIILNVL